MTWEQALEKVKDVCSIWRTCSKPCDDRCYKFRELLAREPAKRGFKRYTNGYEAWWLENHPNEAVLRDVNQLVCAFPDDKIVIMHGGVPVVFLKNIDELRSIEDQMHLKVKDVYYHDEDITITYNEE